MEPRSASQYAPPPGSTPSLGATAHAASGSPRDRGLALSERHDDEGETRPSRRIQNERSRVVDQLTAEASASPALPTPQASPASAGVYEGQPTRVASQPTPARARRPWASIALFSAMLALSVVPLLRYALSRELPQVAPSGRPSPEAPVSSLGSRGGEETASTRSTAPHAMMLDGEREEQIITLIAAGNRSLEQGAVSDAERLFGRVVELDEDNPRAAYGLARVRLTQGNLSGAEGWIQLALRKRPRRRAYHALYAEVLMRLGRTDEAHEEERHATLSEMPGESVERAPTPSADAP